MGSGCEDGVWVRQVKIRTSAFFRGAWFIGWGHIEMVYTVKIGLFAFAIYLNNPPFRLYIMYWLDD